ncbi:MAG: hypothetical protein RXP86_10330 [Acidilobus sp.]
MASCQSKVPEVRYCDESWWQDFFTKDLAEFYASLNGLRRAREALLNELSGDVAQVLVDPQRRDLALRVLFGGLDENCLEKIRQRNYSCDYSCFVDCIKAKTAAHFYKDLFGIGLGEHSDVEDMEERTRLLNLLKIKGFEEIGKEKLGISIKGRDTGIMNRLFELQKIVNYIYSNPKIKQVIPVQQAQLDYGLDLVKAFEDFLNKSIKLLPLYNPFTFFIQSLRSTPRPYLNIMYGEELFSDSVRNLMSKYGVELTKILDPGLNVQPEDDELAVIGHKEGSIGKLIDGLVRKIYDMTFTLSLHGYISDEFKKYVEAKYNEEASTGFTLDKLSKYNMYCDMGWIRVKIRVVKGVVNVHQTKYPYDKIAPIAYDEFLELFSPLLFLGIAWIDGDYLQVAC